MSIDYAKTRETMVEQQVRPWEVLDPRVLDTLLTVPREQFVPEAVRALAYTDMELPLGNGESMLKPVVEGRALQALLPQANESVLEIGTGSGYLSACLAKLAREVTSLEIDPALADRARAALAAQGITNATVETVDAYAWTSSHRFDVICVTGAVAAIPAHFRDWLAPGGRMFIVHGDAPAMQAVRIHADGRVDSLFETDLHYLKGGAALPRFTL
ncbi:protein-L-isoaspartate O-methyltransferase family protein [Solilutibacter silvestris]|uniref:Protein-L-isoaspartate O-methyltransferase n=1 Tax=Solilutibacter silvestris TaxID=1645665 RepID=A0A2K1Q0C4_9GAMM|nr:protein-L-isoaspartate O-methyltransferase [Lysobacter silvestris]PNS08488.1 Protein-L-isoaspartate carboxylmethyltransferase [Lysobacter silvestris]